MGMSMVDVGVMTDVRPTADRTHAPNCGAAVRRNGAPGRYGRRMETARPSQLPSWLLIVVMFMLGICALPAAVFFVLSGISGDSGISPFLVLGLGVPALAGYPSRCGCASGLDELEVPGGLGCSPHSACYWSSVPRRFRWRSLAGHSSKSGARLSPAGAATRRPTAPGDAG